MLCYFLKPSTLRTQLILKVTYGNTQIVESIPPARPQNKGVQRERQRTKGYGNKALFGIRIIDTWDHSFFMIFVIC